MENDPIELTNVFEDDRKTAGRLGQMMQQGFMEDKWRRG